MALTRAKRDIDFSTDTPIGSSPIGVTRAWQSSQTSVGTFSNPATTDTNRLGIIIIAQEDSGGGATLTGVSVDGQIATPIISSFTITTFSNEVAVFYLSDSQLDLITDGSAIVPTFSTGSTNSISSHTAILNNVSQINPVIATDEASTTSTASQTLTAVAEDGGYSIVKISDGTAAATITQNNNLYTEVFNATNGTEYVSALYTLQGTVAGNISSTWSITSPLREVSFMVNLRKS